CIPTPLTNELPDMSFVEAAATQVSENLTGGTLVILESTTYPGTTEQVVLPRLLASGLESGKDFHLGYSPERIDPGNRNHTLRNVPKIVGGLDEQAGRLMEAFYGAFIDKLVPVSSPRIAEMAKLLENTYRHVNIALVNEMAILCHDLGIDVWEVIDAAATKPFGFEPFYPGPGWGGHCIPVDPAYLSWRVRQMGSTARFVELAREFNKLMPVYIVQRCGEALNEIGKSLKGARILVLGVTYKADVADVRESPAEPIIGRLKSAGAEVSFHDPFVERMDINDGTIPRVDPDSSLDSSDLVLIHTPHSSYDWQSILSRARLVLDTRNVTAGLPGPVVKL
ncbi:MAG: nucleotide sugar dehydrogenase, partial [Actinomycetota bacterium]